jgi:queuine/archaeosine tRNA-ribosyltransferase
MRRMRQAVVENTFEAFKRGFYKERTAERHAA